VGIVETTLPEIAIKKQVRMTLLREAQRIRNPLCLLEALAGKALWVDVPRLCPQLFEIQICGELTASPK
jgi:hypothetical protein